MTSKRDIRAGVLMQVTVKSELHTLIKSAAQLEGVTVSEWFRLHCERVARKTIKRAGLKAYDIQNGKIPEAPEEWEKAGIPKYRAYAWQSLGVSVDDALESEVVKNCYPADYKGTQKDEDSE